MVCYGPRLSTIAITGAVGYVLLHRTIVRILHIAGLVLQITLITCAAAAVAALLIWTVRTIKRRRAAMGACTTCRFRCQQPLTLRLQPPAARAGHRPAARIGHRPAALVRSQPPTQPSATIAHDGYLLTPDGVTRERVTDVLALVPTRSDDDGAGGRERG